MYKKKKEEILFTKSQSFEKTVGSFFISSKRKAMLMKIKESSELDQKDPPKGYVEIISETMSTILFDEKNPYIVADHGGRKVQYTDKQEIIDGIMKKYRVKKREIMQETVVHEEPAQQHEPKKKSENQQPEKKTKEKKKSNTEVSTVPRKRREVPSQSKERNNDEPV